MPLDSKEATNGLQASTPGQRAVLDFFIQEWPRKKLGKLMN